MLASNCLSVWRLAPGSFRQLGQHELGLVGVIQLGGTSTRREA
jgi:hypothetical protein